MNRWCHRFSSLPNFQVVLFLGLLGLFSLAAQETLAPENRKLEKKEKMESDVAKKKGRGDLGDLTDKEREKVRRVLSEVWELPEVASARERVRVATEDYRQVLKTAVAKQDPEMVELMSQMHASSKSGALRHKLPQGRPLGPQETLPWILNHEPFYRGLSYQDKKRMQSLVREIEKSGSLKAEMLAFSKSTNSGNTGPKRDPGIRDALRRAFFEQLRAKDPWAKQIIEDNPPADEMRLMQPRGGSGKGGPKGKGPKK